MSDTSAVFTILFWGSHPDANNDDCWSGEDYENEPEARRAYMTAINAGVDYATAYVELDGPNDVHALGRNPNYDAKRVAREDAADKAAWLREIATEAGMLGGCNAYNEVMGY